jgi:beta-N-acetylhexosaminidase
LPSHKPTSKPSAVVFGCSGRELTSEEHAFFRATNPLGLILFQRNCDSPKQVRALVEAFRACVGRDDAAVMIDQEGGRVARLKPPHWPEFPAAKAYADLFAKDPDQGLEAAKLGGRLIGHELADLGISIDCAPVLDVPQPGADPIIGDRAFGPDVDTIVQLAKAFMDGLMKGGITPVIKHIPGHGRALVDSHKDLPLVNAALEDLQAVDFAPFRALHMAGWAMTAHVVYAALDPDLPATLSPGIIENVIRRQLGFQGVLVSDDLSMKALSGSFVERTRACLKAGCDVALHCNGNMDEMAQVAEGVAVDGSEMTRGGWARYKMSKLLTASATKPFASKKEQAKARHRFDTLLG